MENTQKFTSLHIDVENDIYEVNGKDISKTIHKLDLTLENGDWSLVISEDTFYSTNDQIIKE